MLHLGNRKPTRAGPPIKAVLREFPLSAIKAPRRSNHCPQENQQFKHSVRKPRVRMQYPINLPFGLYCLPRPPAVDHESKLVRAGLRKLDDGATHLRVGTEVLKLL